MFQFDLRPRLPLTAHSFRLRHFCVQRTIHPDSRYPFSPFVSLFFLYASATQLHIGLAHPSHSSAALPHYFFGSLITRHATVLVIRP